MKLIYRTITFISILFILFVMREVHTWYLFANELSEYVGYIYVISLIVGLFYFFIFPFGKLIFLPSFGEPVVTLDKWERKEALVDRIKMLGDRSIELENMNEEDLQILLNESITFKEEKADKIIDTHVFRTFKVTSISHSALIDIITILASSLKVSTDLLEHYGGRLNFKDLIIITKHSIFSAALGGSDIVETVTRSTVDIATKGGEAVPIIGPFVSAVADGTVNASLVCRVGLITKYYCINAIVDKEKDWYPSVMAIGKTLKAITGGVWSFLSDSTSSVKKLFALAKKENKVPEMLTGEDNKSWFAKMIARNKKKKKVKKRFQRLIKLKKLKNMKSKN